MKKSDMVFKIAQRCGISREKASACWNIVLAAERESKRTPKPRRKRK